MLFWNTYLATRCKNPTEADMGDLCRAMKYLEGSGNWGIRYRYGVKVSIRIWRDSSHAQHVNGRGHIGILISLGSGMVHGRSVVIKMTTLSSTESEFVCMCEGTTYVIWLRSLLDRLKFSNDKRPVPRMYQDNNSAIWWSKEDMTFARTKHLMIKKNYVKEAVDAQIMVVIPCDTSKMLADDLTKPTQPSVSSRHMVAWGMERIQE